MIFILVLVVLSGLAVGFKTIRIGNFERGSEDTLLGLTLGLDLQGGSHLVYQANLLDAITDEPISPTSDQMESVKKTIERRLNSSGLGEPIVQVLGEDRLLVQIPGVSDPDSAKALIGETAQLEFKHRMLAVPRQLEFDEGDILGFKVVEVTPFLLDPSLTSTTSMPATNANSTDESSATSTATSTAAVGNPPPPPGLEIEFSDGGYTTFSAIVDEMRDSLIPAQGAGTAFPDLLTISVEGTADPEVQIYYQFVFAQGGQIIPLGGDPNVQEIIGTTKYVVNLATALADYDDPIAEAESRFGKGGELAMVLLKGKIDDDINLTGEDLARAYPGQHHASGVPIVNIEFDSEGTRKFGEITAKIAGTTDLLAIVLDNEELIAPSVTQAITGGNAFIQGTDFNIERVRDISLLLESGRLPIPIALIQERDIDAILGSDSLAKSVRAGVVGLALVFLFMALYYRLPGLIAALALLIYALMLVAVFKMLPVTLTLSGVAAAILSIGMAVDANILIFERMKEEMRAGRTLLSSINIGFNRAWSAIRDSNVSTLITSGILFWFADTLGATVVQGFAATLAIGVLFSMFSAIVISRTLLRIVALTVFGRRLRWFVPTEGKSLPQLQPEAEGA